MNLVWRLLAGLVLLLSFGVLTAWAWDKSDTLNRPAAAAAAAATATATATATAAVDGAPVDRAVR